MGEFAYMTGTEDVSLREFFESKLDAIARATTIQSTEMARRLDDLNHSHAQQTADKAEFVRKPTFEQFQATVTDMREALRRETDTARDRVREYIDDKNDAMSKRISALEKRIWLATGGAIAVMGVIQLVFGRLGK